MELVFEKNGEKYEATFEASDNFNIHLEREEGGFVNVYQSGTQGGEYALAANWSDYEGGKVFDCDFGALVYPKYIKVTSRSKVNKAVVTTN